MISLTPAEIRDALTILAHHTENTAAHHHAHLGPTHPHTRHAVLLSDLATHARGLLEEYVTLTHTPKEPA